MPASHIPSHVPSHVLLIEDEAHIRRFVRAALEAEGFQVFEAESAQRGLVEAGTRQPDLVILDLGLPDRDGLEFLRDLRGWSHVPVLVLSARADEKEKIAALDQGADDYLTKPFGVGELLARVRALQRRSPQGEATAVLSFGDIRIDLVARSVFLRNAPIRLTVMEYRLLVFLTSHPNKVMTHRQILREVWGADHADDSHYLRIYMSHLRHKLEKEPSQPRHFLTETGVGYRFVG